MSKILGVVAMYLALILAGCTPAPPSIAGDGYTAQIIVKFSDATMNPSENIFVDQLSHDAGARLIYVRPMSGAAHVFEVRQAIWCGLRGGRPRATRTINLLGYSG
jgi:hypothetical protein